ncbi:hypothetical protein WISP_16539 [Willisornis vidua]|uniref:Uncharacterized protein n=1 Tax=Willisornis vidua TaxID=1566151 RepID=A0ABQ9DSY7_9PASS|nr:hypothetical protein WISP_16539 [Willisornis vidua]
MVDDGQLIDYVCMGTFEFSPMLVLWKRAAKVILQTEYKVIRGKHTLVNLCEEAFGWLKKMSKTADAMKFADNGNTEEYYSFIFKELEAERVWWGTQEALQKTEMGRQCFYHRHSEKEREREKERARRPDQKPKGDDYVVIQRDSFYYLKNQSADLERQVDVLRKINEYERFIDSICSGLDGSGRFRGSDSRSEGNSWSSVECPGLCSIM